jgi:hypothetical protein
MDPVTISEAACNKHVEPVLSWLTVQGQKGDMSESSAMRHQTALRQMAEQIAPDDPGDLEWMLNNMERLQRRWATKNVGGKATTSKTYASRARGSIREYLRWKAAPEKYDRRAVQRRDEGDAKAGPQKKKPATTITVRLPERQPPAEQPVPQPMAQEKVAAKGEPRACSLGPGRESFRYIQPADGMKLRDAVRVAYHLITSCDDYDPFGISPAQVFTNMQRGEAPATPL